MIIFISFKRAFDKLYDLGAQFDQTVSLNYTKLYLYAEKPLLIGNYTQIVSDSTLKNIVMNFYSHYQKLKNFDQIKEIFDDFTVKKAFYFFYNNLYWYLPLKEPFISFTYDKIPLPGQA